MKIWTSSFYKRVFVFTTFLCACVSSAFAEQAPNPRGSGVAAETSVAADSIGGTARSTTTNRVVRNSGNVVSGVSSGRSSTTGVSRSATAARPSTTVSRSAALPSSSSSNVVTGRSGTVVQTVSSGLPTTSARSATVSRSATANVVNGASRSPASTARAAATNSVVGLSRGAATARATAVFSDVSAIGSGYAKCREAYATCMDQFCANANDTYRRCVCSAKYDEFRNTESAIDEALTLLAQFEDNNLAAVELSAEEVNAMYSATEGEMAIKSDTSAAASMLAEINDLLAGRKSVETTDLSSSSLGLLNIDFTSDLDDIWGGTGTSIFDTSTGVDLSSLTGEDLYTQASKQCLEIVADSCENDAVLTMARSAYGIMVTQDCNLYEKNINAQKESLEQTVRTAEKYLREARLAEYQSHNSADVNECIANVRSAILSDAACGPNYERCLDYTGAYINQSTGEPRFSPRLFQLADLITLPGVTSSGASDDVLGANAAFNTFLDSRRMFAESALDSCRDMADIVWEEFKRQALIEIAQAQDEKIEEVKMSCVSTMAECYDTQTGALQDFDTTTAQYTGALSATAARAMCRDQVIACASLYGNTENCEFDGNGRLVSGNATGAAAEQMCGLTALLSFVDTVDTVRIGEGCETAINNYLKDLCTPTSGTKEYPWNCVTLTEDALNTNLENFVRQNCAAGGDDISNFSVQMAKAKEDFYENMDYILMDTCESLNGYWVGRGDNVDSRTENADNLTSFYRAVYGGNENANWGRCVENTTMIQCLSYNEDDQEPVASYDLASDECTFTEAWYKSRCAMLNDGYYENGICYSVSEN